MCYIGPARARRWALAGAVIAAVALDIVLAFLTGFRVPGVTLWALAAVALVSWRAASRAGQQVQRLAQAVHQQAESIQQQAKQVAAARKELAASQDQLLERLDQLGSPETALLRTEALINLYTQLPPTRLMPPTTGFSAPPEVVLRLVSEVLERRPGLVVECGSGASSLWVGYALRQNGFGRLVSLEHDPAYAGQTRAQLAQHGLSEIAEVRDAPLERVEIGAETWLYYAPSAMEDLEEIGLLFVDGPPGRTQNLARYPALPLLEKRLSDNALIVLDDAARPQERAVLARWRKEFPISVRLSPEGRGFAEVERQAPVD